MPMYRTQPALEQPGPGLQPYSCDYLKLEIQPQNTAKTSRKMFCLTSEFYT
jgi:hypothetical protein